jgi:DNA-binding GntR family transcriptional regulator
MASNLVDPAIRPVARPAPLREAVYETLTELIIDGTLRHGQHLVEAELARQLGVSRQPIREALHRLQAEGWVDLRPGLGAFVHTPTEHEVDELLDVRCLLEAEAARLATRAATPESVAKLREISGRGLQAIKGDDVEGIVAANSEFHAHVTEMSGNAVLADLIHFVDRRVRWYYRAVALARGRESWAEHTALIDAMEAGDEAQAAETIRVHTEGTRTAYHTRTS